MFTFYNIFLQEKLCYRRVLQNHYMCGLNLMVMLYLIAFNRFFLPLVLYFGLIAFKKDCKRMSYFTKLSCNWILLTYYTISRERWTNDKTIGFKTICPICVTSLSNHHLGIQITLLPFLEKHSPSICSDLTTWYQEIINTNLWQGCFIFLTINGPRWDQ